MLKNTLGWMTAAQVCGGCSQAGMVVGTAPAELAMPEQIDVVEDAPDFAGNAAKKAVTLAKVVDAMAVGDDSGLCVDALDGRPGVLSARYAGPDATDSDRNQKLLGELEGVEGDARSARFVCNVCLSDADGNILAQFEESCEGHIQLSPSGDGGFGYDPLFVAREYRDSGKSFAELDATDKDAISHRGRALRRLAEWFQEQ